MAKITEASLVPDATPGRKKSFVVRRTRGGSIAAAWPPKVGKWKSPGAFYQQQEFGLVARQVSNPEPTALASAVNIAKGSDQVPRDLLMMAAYGLLYEITFNDGTPVTYVRMVAANAQLTLDQVTDTPGALMYRSPFGWVEILPGNNGDVLAELNGVPTWLPGFIPTPLNPSGPVRQPYFRDANVYLTNQTVGGAALTTLAMGGNTQTLVPVTLPNDRTITSLAAGVTTFVALSNINLAIYHPDPTDGGPGLLIFESGNISSASNGLKTSNPNTALAAGPYFLGIACSAAITIRATNATFTTSNLGFTLGAAVPAPGPYIARSQAYGAWQADLTGVAFNLSGGAAAVPMLGIR